MATKRETGWLALSENGDTSKWNGLQPGKNMEIEGDTWVFTGQDVRAEVGGMSWDDYILSAEVKIDKETPEGQHNVQLTANGTCIYCQLVPGWMQIAYYCDEPKDKPKGFTHLARQAITVPEGTWFTFQMKAEGGVITGILDGREIVSARIPSDVHTDAPPGVKWESTRGMPGLLVNQQKDCVVRVRGMKVKLLKPTDEQLEEYERDAVTNWERHKESTGIRQLRYTVIEDRQDEGVQIRLTELLGTSEVVAPGEVFVARGEYALQAPPIGPLRLAAQGRSSGLEQPLQAGEGRFEVKAMIGEVLAGKEKILDLFITDAKGDHYAALVRVRLEGKEE